mmetsp:Transcript_63738/g.152430  ORF Transcript_63738/g.152430 Transcript_63738/m.152430 type:complete len:542 (+) Transcript_63738:191-1816(+)
MNGSAHAGGGQIQQVDGAGTVTVEAIPAKEEEQGSQRSTGVNHKALAKWKMLQPPKVIQMHRRKHTRKIVLPTWPKINAEELERGKALMFSTQDLDPTSFSSDALCHLAYEMFIALELPPELFITVTTIRNFILAVRELMFDNPYHNFTHVVDVTQTVFALGHQTGLMAKLTPWGRFGLLTSAMCHDLEHPGVTSPFLEKANVELGSEFKDQALEEHHAMRAIEVLTDPGIAVFDGLSTADFYSFRGSVSSSILATQFTRHNEYVQLIKGYIAAMKDHGAGTAEAPPPLDLKFECQVLLKCADISNPAKRLPIACRWALRVTDEFFMQGDEEKKRGFVVSPNCDRATKTRVEVQKGFIDFVITPFFEACAEIYPASMKPYLEQVNKNRVFLENATDADLEGYRDPASKAALETDSPKSWWGNAWTSTNDRKRRRSASEPTPERGQNLRDVVRMAREAHNVQQRDRALEAAEGHKLQGGLRAPDTDEGAEGGLGKSQRTRSSPSGGGARDLGRVVSPEPEHGGSGAGGGSATPPNTAEKQHR